MKKELFSNKFNNTNELEKCGLLELDRIKKIIGLILDIPYNYIDESTEFAEYGFDSITYTEFANQLNQIFDVDIIPTVFYEYRNLKKLIEFLKKKSNENSKQKEEIIDTIDFKELTVKDEDNSGKIAIIGMSGKFPGAKNLYEFWNNLLDGKECISEIPIERWDWKKIYGDPQKENGKTNIKWGGFIDGIEEFDPLFFGISPKQAELMDPQQRLILEYTYKAIEDAGYAPRKLAGTRIGIFIGGGMSGYSSLLLEKNNQRDGYFAVGNAAAMGANRASYFFDFHGPSEMIDTACSSSLVAIHRAICAINNGDCESAIVGGVNTILTPDLHICFNKANMLSEDGHCNAFSDKANGYVRGEGIGIIYIKKLEDAIKAHDYIYGIICGSGENHGGHATSITAPNPEAQVDVIKNAFLKSGIDPQSISYQEAHGTGTVLGDPIEVQSLCKAFEKTENKVFESEKYCGLGTLKPNIGHLEYAAGIASVIKVLLQFKYKTLVKTINCEKLNPYISLENSPFFIVKNNMEWPLLSNKVNNYKYPRRAGISSFGFGGVNSYVILEEYDNPKLSSKENETCVYIPFSAKNSKSLKDLCNSFLDYLKREGTDKNLLNIAYTMQTGRDSMESRLVIEAKSVEQLIERIDYFLSNSTNRLLVSDYIEDNIFLQTAKRWVDGEDVKWENLYHDLQPYKVNLPSYVFDNHKLWICNDQDKYKDVNRQPVILKKIWKEEKLHEQPNKKYSLIIVFGTKNTLKMTDKLFLDSDETIIKIIHNAEDDKNNMGIDFYSEKDAIKVWDSVSNKKEFSYNAEIGVVDLTALDSEYENIENLEEGKIKLLQCFLQNPQDRKYNILQVTENLQDFENDATTMSGARTYGFYKMLQTEYSFVKATTMDSDCKLQQDELVHQIDYEFRQIDSNFTECCYRKNRRYLPQLVLNEIVESESNQEEVYSKADVILITGGLGGIGSSLGEKIIKNGAQNLVIIGREKLPNNKLLKMNENTKFSEMQLNKMKKLQRLRELGANVYYYSVSVTDKESLKNLYKKIRSDIGEITEIYHCAGVNGKNPMFIKKTISEIKAVWEPKVKGVLVLSEVLQNAPIRKFFLFSSISSTVPMLAKGISDYSMANAFLDHYSTYQNKKNSFCYTSIIWSAWEESGMQMGELQTPTYINLGIKTQTNFESWRFINYIRKHDFSTVIPMIVDKSKFKANVLLKTNNQDSNLAKARVESLMCNIFADELHMDLKDISKTKPFEEYGVDSIVIAQLVHKIQEKLKVNVSPDLLIQYRTISQLANYIITHDDNTIKLNESNQTKHETEHKNNVINNDIAIIGMACRFPGATDKKEYWDLLINGKNAIKRKPVNRKKKNEIGDIYGGWIENLQDFDNKYFHISGSDSEIMSLQAKIMLKESLKAIYDAGYNLKELAGKNIGVYIGARMNDLVSMETIMQAQNPILGIGSNYIASNISRFFDFHGPSMLIDTACSSAIVALSTAIDSLKDKKIDMALVGGVNILEGDIAHRIFAKRNILNNSRDFKIFDNNAHGEILGEGGGVIVVKRLKDAIKDGDQIYSVIKNVSINNDGRTLGPGSPNPQAQKEVLEKALKATQKMPGDIDYIEVNGGGTKIMDCIELKALSEVYELQNKSLKKCVLGSVKPNIGHLVFASGIASLIKCALSIYNKKIPPFLSAIDPLDDYEFDTSRICFNREVMEWDIERGQSRCAAINSFPDGGTNCHLILEEFDCGTEYMKRRTSIEYINKCESRYNVWGKVE